MSSSEQWSKTSEGLWIRCPRLGGEAPFTYCMQEAGDLPCHRIIVCWQAYFPVEAYLRKKLSPQKWEFQRSTAREEIEPALINRQLSKT